MAVVSAQMPNLASRAAPLGGGQRRSAIFLGYIGRKQRLAAAHQFALHRVFRAGHEHKGALAAIAIRQIVFAVQRHLAAAGDGGQRGPAAGPVGSSVRDAGEADLAAVFEAKVARIDHGGDAAFTLRLERAIGGENLPARSQHQKRRGGCPATRQAGSVITRLSIPVRCGMLDIGSIAT